MVHLAHYTLAYDDLSENGDGQQEVVRCDGYAAVKVIYDESITYQSTAKELGGLIILGRAEAGDQGEGKHRESDIHF